MMELRLATILALILVAVMAEDSRNETRVRKKHRDKFKDDSDERKLLRVLLSNYDIEGRPVREMNTTTSVGFGLGLIQMDLNEKEKMLTLSMWSRYTWKDEYLTWDPDEHNGISSVRLQIHLIWVPDIELYNTADVNIPLKDALAIVASDGTVTWFPHAIFKSSCDVNTRNFPFDQQECSLAFGSWTHPSHEVDLYMLFPGGIDLSTFENDHYDASAWDVYNVTADVSKVPSDEVNHFAVMTFEMFLRRKLSFSSYILTLPCIFLSLLTLTVFWIPPDRTDRIGLAFGTFGSLLLLLLLLVESSPASPGSVPTLGVYYCFNIVIIFGSIMVSSFVVNITRGPDDKKSRLPRFVAVIFLEGLGRLFCLKSFYGKGRKELNALTKKDDGDSTSIHRVKNGQPRVSRIRYYAGGRELDALSQPQFSCEDFGSVSGLGRLEVDVTDIRSRVTRLIQDVNVENQHVAEIEVATREWKQLAVVIDRFFFYLYLILITVSLAFFFPRPEYDWI